MAVDATSYYRNQIATYTDAIRMSDFKANIGVVYGAFTIGPAIGYASEFPPFLPCLRSCSRLSLFSSVFSRV